MYTVQGKDFVATDVTSLTQVMDVARKQWVWVDIYDPNRKESEIILELLGNEPEFADQIEKRVINPLSIHKGCVLCDYEKVQDCVCLTIPSIALEEQFRSYPIVLVKKKKMFITWGEEDGAHSKLIKLTIRRLRELVEEGEKPNSALAIGMLLREIAINNSDVLLSVRERIDQMEEQALENGGKQLVHSVFSLKKIISTLYRVMINEKDFMLDVDKSVIPRIKLDEKSKSIVDEAIEIIDRELDFMDSYTRTLDSILTLQDLASIHKVESSINYLTIVLVIGTAILILLELLVVLELI
jgi:Mg2+ and Co2+ transporter CorA